MNLPSFSIVVPTYQRRDLVCEVVGAIAAIVYAGPFELIVIVDGSTDGTQAALAAIDCPFPKKVVAQENTGLAGARNRGAAEARNDIILFLDDDMICRPDILQQHARSHVAGADAVLGHIPLDESSPKGMLATGTGKWADERSERLINGATLSLFDLVGGHMSVRRLVFEELGGFDRRFTRNGSYGDEDLDFGTRLVGSYTVRFNPDAVSYQRYIVTPRQHMRQWYEAGKADVVFARKHPDRAEELFALHGAERRHSRLLLRPISAVPGAPALLSALAVWLVSWEHHLPVALGRPLGWLFCGGRDVVYWKGVRDAGGVPSHNRVLILCYHAIADLSGDPVLAEYGITREVFAGQLDALLERGFTFATPDELLALIDGRARVPRKALLLTFDDCYEELTEVARSVLEPRGVTGIAFAVSGMPSGTNEWDQPAGARKLRLLDASGLQELSRHGLEIGCHSRTHRQLPTLGDSALVEETRGSSEEIVALGLPRPRFFAYPHGAQDARCRAAAQAAEFNAAFALSSQPASRASDPFALPRVEILASDVGWRFRLKTSAPRLSLCVIYARTLVIRAVRKARRLIGRAPNGSLKASVD